MPLSTYKAQHSQQQRERQQQQQQEEAPPPPYTYTPTRTGPAAAAAAAGAVTQSRQLMSPPTMLGANGSGIPPCEFSRQLQFPPVMPGGPGSANPVPHAGVAPSLPPRTPRTPRAPQFRGTIGAPQLYGEGVVDMSGGEYDAVPDSYFARPTGPRAPQLDTQEEEPVQGKQQEPVAASVGAAMLEKDDIQSYYQSPVFPDKKGEKPLQDVKQPILEQPDPYYQSHQQSAPVVYRPPAAPQFSSQADQHQQLHSISSVVNPVSSPAMGYAETPTMYHPLTTAYPPPAAAQSPTLSHYPSPSTPSMFSSAAVVRPLPVVPLHHSSSVSMPVPMPMPEPSKLPMSPPAPEHASIVAPTPALAPASIPPPTAAIPGGGGPGLVTNYKCKECGGLLNSEFAVCTRLHTPLTAHAAPQIGYSTRPDFHLDGQHPVPLAPVPQHHHHQQQQQQHAYYPQPHQQQQQQQHGYYPQPQQHHYHPHNPYPQQQLHYGGYAHHYPQPTVATAIAAHPSNNHGTDDAYYKRPLTNGLKKLFGVTTQSYGFNHQIVSPLPVAPPPMQPVNHHMPGPQGQAGAYIPLAGPPPPQHQYYQHQQQQQQYPPAPYPAEHHHGMMSPVVGFQQPHYAMPGGGKDGYGAAGAGLMRSSISTQPRST